MKKLKNLFSKKDKNFNLKRYWPFSKTSGKIFLIYFLIVIIGGILVSIPNFSLTSHNKKLNWDFLSGFFTASSAFSSAGINLSDPSQDYTFIGQFIILVLIELGGIGVLTFKLLIFSLINKNITIDDTNIAKLERGTHEKNLTTEIIKTGFLWLTSIQMIAAFIMFFLFFFSKIDVSDPNINSPYKDYSKSLWFAIFHATSAVNNSGFDIISNNSLKPYNSNGNFYYTLQIVFMLEWIIGGLGYPFFYDLKRKIKSIFTGEKTKFSLFTKVSVLMYIILFFSGSIILVLIEYFDNNSKIFHTLEEDGTKKSNYQIIFDIIFNSSSTRNAGFTSINIERFNDTSKIIFNVLTFIGSSPSSTAGGIRTTTFVILLASLWSVITNKKHVNLFKKTIPESTVKQSYVVFFISILIVLISIIIVSCNIGTNNKNITIDKIVMLIISAYGTSGITNFSTEEIYNLGFWSKFSIIICMFIGQLGVSNALYTFSKNHNKIQVKYLEEALIIG